MARGEHASPGTTTVGELARWWLDTVVSGQVRSPLTAEQYKTIVNRHLIPALGDVLVTELSAAQVDGWLAERSHLARSYLARLRSTLTQILRHGERRGLVHGRNVAAIAVVPPAKAARKRRSLTPGEARALLAAAQGEPLEALFVVGLCLGLRPGEFTGLLWSDIDLDADPPTLSVSGSAKIGTGGRLWRDDSPKRSTAGRRTLALPARAAAALAAHRERSGGGDGLVFAAAGGGIVRLQALDRTFSRIARRAGIEGGFPYLMRHTSASLMLDQGASLEEVADMLGDDPRTLLGHYRHRVRPAAAAGLRMGKLLDDTGTTDGDAGTRRAGGDRS